MNDQNNNNQTTANPSVQNPTAADLNNLISQLAKQVDSGQPAGSEDSQSAGNPKSQVPNPNEIQNPNPSAGSGQVVQDQKTAETVIEPVVEESKPNEPIANESVPAPVVEAPVEPAPVTEPVPAEPKAEEKMSTGKKIVIYTTATCPFCKAEKEYLSEKGLSFEEKNVETDENALKEMLSISDNFAGVPVTMLQNEKGEKMVVRGFTKADFEEELVKLGLIESANPAAGSGQVVQDQKPAEAVTSSDSDAATQPTPTDVGPAPVEPVQSNPEPVQPVVSEPNPPTTGGIGQANPGVGAPAPTPTIPDLN